MKHYRKSLILVLFIVLIAGCTTLGKPMTVKQNATAWMDIYNSTYDDTMAVMINPHSTTEQRAIALQKKELLKKIWPLMTQYVGLVEIGSIPTAENTAQINNLINQLVLIGGK
jgi:hypothetical protein